ncbi:hypothetical protein VTN77DRAFT_4870 [Rasamsonia byssochlamydoides]|uniref:uncharacterized protein n=1 Tax=Rasamsonia byssochlamydoides TaxID=89139 RepID=UPI0037446BBE
MARSPVATRACTLIPIDLDNPSKFMELRRQRIICGWDSSNADLQRWREKQREGLKALFWIALPAAASSTSSTATELVHAGHICLDSYCDPPDPELATSDKSIMTIQSFFILPEYRRSGMGQHAMDLIESMATKEPFGSPRCKFITVNTLSKRYLRDEGPEWRGIWNDLARKPPAFSNQEWYERRGYVQWKEEPRYQGRTWDGREVVLVASFMRKEVE